MRYNDFMLLGGYSMTRYTGNHCPVCEQAFYRYGRHRCLPRLRYPLPPGLLEKGRGLYAPPEHAAGFEWQPEIGPNADKAAHEATCPNCGTRNTPGAARCSHCGCPPAPQRGRQCRCRQARGAGPHLRPRPVCGEQPQRPPARTSRPTALTGRAASTAGRSAPRIRSTASRPRTGPPM